MCLQAQEASTSTAEQHGNRARWPRVQLSLDPFLTQLAAGTLLARCPMTYGPRVRRDRTRKVTSAGHAGANCGGRMGRLWTVPVDLPGSCQARSAIESQAERLCDLANLPTPS